MKVLDRLVGLAAPKHIVDMRKILVAVRLKPSFDHDAAQPGPPHIPGQRETVSVAEMGICETSSSGDP